MKTIVFVCLLSFVCLVNAQNTFLPLNKAGKTSSHIFIANYKEVLKFVKRSDKYPLCTGLKIDFRTFSKLEVTELIMFLRTHTDIVELHLHYASSDSVDFKDLSGLKHITALTLQNETFDYAPVS